MTTNKQNSDCKSSQRLEDGGDSCCVDCDPGATRTDIVRIATWASAAPELQQYLNFYQSVNPEVGSVIRLSILPSLQDLQVETRKLQQQQPHTLYDGFVVPPMLLGNLLEQDALLALNVDKHGDSNIVQFWKDLLPYYKNSVATLDGAVRSIPLLAGNQLLLLFRKDYLDSQQLPTPKTWSEFIRVAATLHNQPIGPDGQAIYGSCLGRLSEAACRQQMDQNPNKDELCHSLSMSYLSSSLAQMTQVQGNTTGWLFDDDATTRNGMFPLLNPTLERLLVLMEQQLKFGAPDELQRDASLNMQLFEQGRCAMTVSADHPDDLLSQPNVGFVPLPGSHHFLARKGANTMVECTPELCPHGVDYDVWGRVNRVPFGAHDMMVGSVSALSNNPKTVQEFLEFVFTTKLNVSSPREQPMTYTGLQASKAPGYANTMEELTSSPNVGVPFRIPNAYTLMTELDTRVYDYLVVGNYTTANRQALRESVEQSWTRGIQHCDQQPRSTVPTSVFYEKSLGIFAPEPTSDLYIGRAFRAFGWGLGAFACCTSLFFAFWVWKYQNERIVQASQPIFLWTVCAGTFIMSVCIFPFGVEDDIASERATDAACMVAFWCYSLGYTTTFAALFSKMWRINRIFRQARNLQRIKIETKDILLPFCRLFGANCVFLLVWTITDPVTWLRVPINEDSISNTSTFGTCDSQHYRIYLGIILSTNLVVSLVALIQAYECRRITTEYSESLWITGIMGCIIQIWIVGLPILKLLSDNPRGTFFVKVGIVFITGMSTLLLLFVPKMRYLKQCLSEPKEEGFVKGGGALRVPNMTDGRFSETTHEHSQASEDTHVKFHHSVQVMHMGNTRVSGLEPPATNVAKPAAAPQKYSSSGMEGIRIIQSSIGHSEEVERLQKSLDGAESRNKVLNDRLERLQEKMEQYAVVHHGPHGGTHGGSYIIAARPEQAARVSGTDESQ